MDPATIPHRPDPRALADDADMAARRDHDVACGRLSPIPNTNRRDGAEEK